MVRGNCSIWPDHCCGTVGPRPVARSWTCGPRCWKAAIWPRHFRRWRPQACDGQPVAVEAVVEGQPRRLPGKIETNLLRIAQEAVTNALKHGKPSRVILCLSFVEQGVELHVEDDGAGFDFEQAMALSAGHFGLLGMRERAERIHAGFKIQSAPGKGTTIKVAADDNLPERNS